MKPDQGPATVAPPKNKRFIGVLLQLFFSLAVIGCGVALAMHYLNTSPKAKPRKRIANPPIVQIETVTYRPHKLTVTGMGTVMASREINLTPKVAGEIIDINTKFNPGSFFYKGEQILSIDPIDYQLTILQLQSEVAKAQSDLELEMGHQLIAKKEFEILGQKVSAAEKNLMLRQPQQAIKKATLDAAQAKLAQADLNLTRTKVKAPFNSVVQARSVNIGSRVSESTTLAKFVGTDEFWLKISIPVQQLKWLNIPAGGSQQQGPEAKIFLQDPGTDRDFRTGKVAQLAAGLEEQGRMAIVYVAVGDPLCLKPENSNKPKLLLGSYVQVEIEGIELPSALPVSRHHLRDGDTVWLLNEKNNLEIRPVEIITKNINQVIIGSGIKDGEKLIISSLSAPISGTPVQLMRDDKITKDNPEGKVKIKEMTIREEATR